MSSFSFCVTCLVLVASVQSYVLPETASVSFVDSADPSKEWPLEKDVYFLDKATPTTLNDVTESVETKDREGLVAESCPKGTKRAGPMCVEDSEEMEDRDGISGAFNNCPEGYDRVQSACVPQESDSKELSEVVQVEVRRSTSNQCPLGYIQAGPVCVQEDDY